MRDLAPFIARRLVEEGWMPCGPQFAFRWTIVHFPRATNEQTLRGYEIAVELYEDDYLFEMA